MGKFCRDSDRAKYSTLSTLKKRIHHLKSSVFSRSVNTRQIAISGCDWYKRQCEYWSPSSFVLTQIAAWKPALGPKFVRRWKYCHSGQYPTQTNDRIANMMVFWNLYAFYSEKARPLSEIQRVFPLGKHAVIRCFRMWLVLRPKNAIIPQINNLTVSS